MLQHTSILINGRFLSQKMHGVQRYAFEICQELIKYSDAIKIAVPHNTKASEVFQKHIVVVGTKQGTYWEQIDLPRYAKRQSSLIINLCNTAPVFYKKNIITIHDLGIYVNPKWYHPLFVKWYKYLTPRMIKNALAICTVSETVQAELMDTFGIAKDRISVTYNGLSRNFKSSTSIPKEKVILYVGAFSKRKNIKILIDAFEAAQPADYKLVLCGHVNRNLTEIEMNTQHAKIEVYENLSDRELQAWYAKASFIINPSLYEGFGLPVLEGIAHGAIPILSDIPVFRELYNRGALFFAPTDTHRLAILLGSFKSKTLPLADADRANYIEKYNYASSAITIWGLIQKYQILK